MAEAEKSNFASFGRVSVTAPLTVRQSTEAPAGSTAAAASTRPLTVRARKEWRVP
jgi:predicted DNA-binding ribbon-helix-helix protein